MLDDNPLPTMWQAIVPSHLLRHGKRIGKIHDDDSNSEGSGRNGKGVVGMRRHFRQVKVHDQADIRCMRQYKSGLIKAEKYDNIVNEAPKWT